MGMLFRKRYRDRASGEVHQCRTWTIRYYGPGGRQLEESTGLTSEKLARKLLHKREGDRAAGLPVGPEIGRIRFSDAVRAVYDDYELRGRRSLDDVKRRVKLHLSPFFGNRKLVEIATDLLRSYSATRMKAGAAAATIRLELAVVKRAFRLAFQANLISRIPHIPMPTGDNARTGFFENEQVHAVLAHLRPDVAAIVRFAFVTGWRCVSEVLPLEWRQVDFPAGEVRLERGSTKNGEGRTFPMTPALRTLLEGQQAIHEAFKERGKIVRFVFPTAAGERFVWFPRDAWATACKTAGCPGRVPHDLRRTAVRNLVRAGVSEKVAMTMTGHKTRSVFERYNIVSGDDLRAAAMKLATAIDTVIGTRPTAAESSNTTQRGFHKTLRKSANSARSVAS